MGHHGTDAPTARRGTLRPLPPPLTNTQIYNPPFIGQEDVSPHAGQLGGQLLQRLCKGDICQDDAVLRVVDDVLQVGVEEARVEGVAYRPDAHDGVPALQVAVRVPGHGGHAVALPV